MDNNNSTNNNLDNLENNNSFNNMVDNLDNRNNININTYNSNLNNNLNKNDSSIVSESVVSNNFNNNVNSNSSIIENVDNINNVSNYNSNNNSNTSYSSNYKNSNNTGLYIIIIVLVALVIYLGIMLIFNKSNDKVEYNDTDIVIEYNNGKIIKSELYDEMLNYYNISTLLDMVDKNILNPMYPENNEMKNSINETYDSYISYYSQSGYTEEQFLEGNGFDNKDGFLDVLRLDYRRNKYLNDYIKKSISYDEIKNYYDNNVFGEIDSKHILVKINDTEGKYSFNIKEADNLAKEIINQLNNGKTFDEVKEEYKDKITYEELGYQAFNASLESNYIKEMKDLEIGEYSEIPVKTSYGYHVIYKIDQKEKPSIDEVKEDILEILSEQKQSEDSNILYKALIELRKDNNVIFKDEELKEKYDNYVDSIK